MIQRRSRPAEKKKEWAGPPLGAGSVRGNRAVSAAWTRTGCDDGPFGGPCNPGADMPAARLLRLIGLRPFRRRPVWRGAASGWGPAAWAGRGLQRGGVSPFARRGPSPSACLMRAGTLSDGPPVAGPACLFSVMRGGWRLASRFMRSRRSSGRVKAETAGVFRCFDAVHDGVSFPSWRPMACAVGRHGCFSVGQRRYAGYRPDAAMVATMMARLVSGSSSSAAMAARVAAFPSPSHHAR